MSEDLQLAEFYEFGAEHMYAISAIHVQSEVNKAVEKAVDKVTKEKDAVIDKQASTINKQAQRMINTVKWMKAKGMSVTDIMDITGLTAEEIESIR